MNHKTWQLEKARVPTQGKSGGCLQDPLNSSDNLKESHQLFGQTNAKSAWVTMYFPRWKPNHKQKNKKQKQKTWQLKPAAVKAWQSIKPLHTVIAFTHHARAVNPQGLSRTRKTLLNLPWSVSSYKSLHIQLYSVCSKLKNSITCNTTLPEELQKRWAGKPCRRSTWWQPWHRYQGWSMEAGAVEVRVLGRRTWRSPDRSTDLNHPPGFRYRRTYCCSWECNQPTGHLE